MNRSGNDEVRGDSFAPMSEVERLRLFLYLLLRDSTPFGAMEKALEKVQEIDGKGIPAIYSEPHQAAYARALARAILSPSEGRGHG